MDDREKVIEDMQDAFRQIGDFAEGLNNTLGYLLEGMTERTVVDLTLKKIMTLVEENI